MPQQYDLVRLGPALTDPESGKVLGHRMDHLGIAENLDSNEIRRLKVVEAYKEIRNGDRFLPKGPDDGLHFFPQAPDKQVKGRLFASEENLSELGQW